MAEAEGCELVDRPFLKPVKEVKQGRWIGVATDLDNKDRRHLIAHALAHHLLHCGNQLSFYHRKIKDRLEQEAEVCAAHILMPGAELEKIITHSFWELAEYFEVPDELAYQRINEFATEQERELWEESSQD